MAPQIDPAEARECLEFLGLSSFEAHVYLALLRGPRTQREVAGETNEQEGHVADCLASLARRGLLNRLPGKPTRFAVAAPEASLPALIRGREQLIEESRRVVELFSTEYRTAGGPAAESYIEVVLGAQSSLAEVERLQARATKEILGFVKPPFLSLENPGERQALTRGVHNRWLWAKAALEAPGMMDVASGYARRGEVIRVVPHLPSKLVIIDDEVAVIHVTEAAPGESIAAALSTRHPELVATLRQLFEVLWSAGVPLEVSEHVETSTEDEDRLALIRCLVGGLTDVATARELGISRRTLTRRIQDLLDDLQVENRFQAGFKLGMAGSEAREANDPVANLGQARPWPKVAAGPDAASDEVSPSGKPNGGPQS